MTVIRTSSVVIALIAILETGSRARSEIMEKTDPVAIGQEKESPDDDSKPLTFDELKELSWDINDLSTPNLRKVMDIVEKYEPSKFTDELDLELLESRTQREIRKFVSEVFKDRGGSSHPKSCSCNEAVKATAGSEDC